jgi:creatine kinase
VAEVRAEAKLAHPTHNARILAKPPFLLQFAIVRALVLLQLSLILPPLPSSDRQLPPTKLCRGMPLLHLRCAHPAVFGPKLAKIAEIKKSFPNNLAIKHFDFDYFASLSASDKAELLNIVNSGIVNPDSGMGCYAMNPSDYDKYEPFFGAVIADYHKVDRSAKHVTDWSLSGVKGLPEGGVLDVTKLGLPPVSMRVRVGRNLQDFPLPGAMTKADRIAMEDKLSKAFGELKKLFGGRYHSLTPGNADFINADEYKALVKARFMFKDMAADSYLTSAGIASDWPYGRGCYVSGDKQFIIWVGEEDHMRIMCMNKSGTIINETFERLKKCLDTVEGIEGLKFAHSDKYGYVTSCPTNLGTGMRASVLMKIPKLTAGGSQKRADATCKPLGLGVRGMGGEHTPIGADGTCDISPTARFCIKEAEIVTALYTGIRNLKAEEDKC